LTKIVKLILETIFLKIILLDAVFSASRKAFHTTFPGFMSVAVFVTDQSKYTENFETKNAMRKKKDNKPSL
jgi:hypothetical protein